MGQQYQCQTLILISKLIHNPVLKRLVVVFRLPKLAFYLVSPQVLKRALVIDVLNTHDVKLARRLYEFLNPGDVLLGDRAFCSYADLVSVKNRQAEAVFRKHQGRKQELRRGKIVGSHDKQVVWHKPQNCPKGLTKEEFLRLPNGI